MVFFQARLWPKGDDAQIMYAFMANRLESSHLSIFLAQSNNNIPLMAQCVETGKGAFNLMLPLLAMINYKTPEIWPAWYVYMKLQAIIFGCFEDILTAKYDPIKSCEYYWDQWAQEE